MNIRIQFFVFLLLVTVSMLIAMPVLAQLVEPDVPTSVDVEGAAALLIATLVTIIGRYIHSPVTMFLVSLTKRLSFLRGVSAQTQTVWVAGILWVITAIAQYVGFGEQWGNFMIVFAQIAPPVAGFVSTLIRAPMLYDQAEAVSAPIVGHARTPREGIAAVSWG